MRPALLALALLVAALALALPRAAAEGEPLFYAQVSVDADGWYLVSAPGGPFLPYDYENGTLLPYVAVGFIDGNYTVAVWLSAGDHLLELRNETPSYVYGGGAEQHIKFIYDKQGYRSPTVYSDGYFSQTARLGHDSLAVLCLSYPDSYDKIGVIGSYYGFYAQRGSGLYEYRVSVETSSGSWSQTMYLSTRTPCFVLLGDGVSRYYVAALPGPGAPVSSAVYTTTELGEVTGIYRFFAASYSYFRLGLLIESVGRAGVELSAEPPGAGGESTGTGTGTGAATGWNMTTSWGAWQPSGCGDPRKPTYTVEAMPPILVTGQIGGPAGEHVELHVYWITDKGLPWLNGGVEWLPLGNVSLGDYQCIKLWVGWSPANVANITEAELSGELVVPITPWSFKAYRSGWPSFPLDAQLPEDITGDAVFVVANIFETPEWRIIVWTQYPTEITEGGRQGFLGRLLSALLEPIRNALASAFTALLSMLPEPVKNTLTSAMGLLMAVLGVVGSFLAQLPGYVSAYSSLLAALAPLIIVSIAMEPELFIKLVAGIISIISKIVGLFKP